MPATDKYNPPKLKLKSKFTGYYTEMTEDDLEKFCNDGVIKRLDYSLKDVERERFQQHTEARSYKERLIERIEWNGTHKSIIAQLVYIRKINNIKHEKKIQ